MSRYSGWTYALLTLTSHFTISWALMSSSFVVLQFFIFVASEAPGIANGAIPFFTLVFLAFCSTPIPFLIVYSTRYYYNIIRFYILYFSYLKMLKTKTLRIVSNTVLLSHAVFLLIVRGY